MPFGDCVIYLLLALRNHILILTFATAQRGKTSATCLSFSPSTTSARLFHHGAYPNISGLWLCW
eukprot:8735083-Heterocapsa_arctica.AAC.1